ncbi:myosin tail region-interacting protein MTI1, partial [Lecanoromycetidae sp. Uapishka_2]
MAVPPFRVKALYDYNSKEDDDLKFPNGQIISVTDEEDADWYFGEYQDDTGNKQEGLFPKNFVKIYEPETPPRPSRISRNKKELEPLAPASAEEKDYSTTEPEASSPPSVSTFGSIEQSNAPTQPLEDVQKPSVPSSKGEAFSATPQPNTSKPVAPSAPKPGPPPAADKPAIGSFRDRINAFNKPAAPPVAPMKPSALGVAGGSGFVKKPFVAPPPSKNAYVAPPREPPPQKMYRREEDPDVVAQTQREAESEDMPVPPQAAPSTDESEDQPKPTSLKERIALLQKQQMEQAARHAETGQKKEKPKRPIKKHVEPQESIAGQDEDVEGEGLERINSGDTTHKPSRLRKSGEATPLASPVAGPVREFLNDPNDADHSAVGETEEGEELSTGRDDSDEKPRRKTSMPLQRPSQAPVQEADEEDNAEEDDVEEEEEEEEDVDPEVKRRMEIRERMAKMSGGMGMAGMFGHPGGLPSRSSTKQNSVANERKASNNSIPGQADEQSPRAPPVPVMPMPGLHKIQNPELNASPIEVSKEEEDVPRSVIQGREPEEMPDVEDMKEEPIPPLRRSTERAAPPPIPQDRPVPAPPAQSRAALPPLPSERPVPPPPSESRPVPRLPTSQVLSLSEGSESDDEMSSRPPTRGDGPPPLPPSGAPPSMPSRPAAPPARQSDFSGRSPLEQSMDMSPTSASASQALPAPPYRGSRVPPIPGSSPAMSSAPHDRAPPPPPPGSAPPPAIPNGSSRAPPMPPAAFRARDLEESDEEMYEGDYDTDMAPGATHKDALKSHARTSSLEDDSMTDETSLHHPGLPSLGPVPSGAPRAVPPPPPNQPPKNNRQSSEMPRAAPPPPPPPREQAYDEDDEDYDPYRYSTSSQRHPSGDRRDIEGPVTPRVEEPDPISPISPPPQRAMPPSMMQGSQQYTTSPNVAAPGRSAPRQSTDMQRSSTTIRRSTDAPRPSGEQGFIAGDVDLGQSSVWWARPDTPPPIFQNRRDLVFEIEETSTTRRGGKQTITKVVYVLFMDYSQTVVTAHFEAKEPTDAGLEQRHEPPPQNLRQDQLENAHTRFGLRIAENANTKENSVVGDGSPHAFVLDLMSTLPEALLPVGVRAYGALVYANLANASVRQFDEIRSGDIVTFRNTKFQGHRGAMHSKYSIEVGKPDHVGIVIDWDGTKKKVRAWEQGRESKKVKAESYKLGDMRSGEVKVWRVMPRDWVGWN